MNWRFRFGRYLELQAIRSAKMVMAISEHTSRDVQRLLGIPAERIVVTPLGVDAKFFSVSPASAESDAAIRSRLGVAHGRDILLYVGGIDPRKNWSVMLSAMEGLRGRAGGGPVLVMAGRIESDDQYPRLLAQIERRGLNDHVRLAGYLEESEMLALYSISSAFIFPSLYEGFGLPPLEAFAAGVPVVSSNSSAMPEVLGDAALLVDPNDPRQFIEAICALLDDRGKAAQYREWGRKRAALFTWERTGRETVRAYQRYARGEFA